MATNHNLLGNNLKLWNWEGEILSIQDDESNSSSLSPSHGMIRIELVENIPLDCAQMLRTEPRSHRPLICVEGHRSNNCQGQDEGGEGLGKNIRKYSGLWNVEKIEKNFIYCSSSHSSKLSCSSLWKDQYYVHKPSATTQCTESNLQFLSTSSSSSCAISDSEFTSSQSIGRLYLAPTLVFHCLINIFNIIAIDTLSQTFHVEFYTELRLKYISDHEDEEALKQLLDCYDISLSKINFLNVSEFITEKEIWTSFGSNQTTSTSTSSGASSSLATSSAGASSASPSQPLSGQETLARRGEGGGGGEVVAAKGHQQEALKDFVIKIRCQAIFIEKMELEDFPFDLQDLNISITVNSSIHRVALRPNYKYPSIFQVNNFQLSSIFEVVYQDVVIASISSSNSSESSAAIIYPRCRYTISLWRKTGYYLSNVLVPICVLTLLSPLSCAINDDGTSLSTPDRLGITLTLLLTSVAYKFVVAASIPTVSYLTLLDSYVLLCFGFICLNAVENVIFPLAVYRYDAPKRHEWYFVIIYYGLFLFINCFYLGNIIYCSRQRYNIQNISLTIERIRRYVARQLPGSSSSHEIEKIVQEVIHEHGMFEFTNQHLHQIKINIMKYFEFSRSKKVRNINDEVNLLDDYSRSIVSAIKKLEKK